tara:strand:- start:1554 stop:1682 length:129 start_codon:yes stop_codon:yes gene_type:complete
MIALLNTSATFVNLESQSPEITAQTFDVLMTIISPELVIALD